MFNDSRRYDRFITGWLIALHVIACAAPFVFSWSGLALFIVLAIATGMAITLGFHRLLTHNGFATYPWVRYVLAVAGQLAGQGPVIQWVADHRAHHKYSDAPGDPHSPREGFAWAHVIWSTPWRSPDWIKEHHAKYCPDLLADGIMSGISQAFFLCNFVLGFVLFAAGYAFGGLYLGASWLVWGLILRMVYVLHATWFVNSCAHKFGYRTYTTRDDSTNLWWVALTTFGEGWHNNHHASPVACNHGQQWWEFDPTYRVIQLMERLGLAWDVKCQHVIPRWSLRDQ
jgi:fatty-acid desaturase